MNNIFLKKKSESYFVIIGCGRLGANLANTLSNYGENVLIIDKNNSSFPKLAPSYGGLTLVGDATDMFILEEAEIKKATTVIAVTNNDNTNIFVAQIVKEYFNVPHVIARLYDPERECVYQELQITTICPSILSNREINKILGMEAIKEEKGEKKSSTNRRIQND